MKYWTDPWGLVHGCTPVSQACKHCWAASEAHIRAHQKNPRTRAHYEGLTFLKDGVPTFNNTVRTEYDALEKPLRARKPRIYAVGWGGDLFHEKVPIGFIYRAYNIMTQAKHHTFLVLTKRPEQMAHIALFLVNAASLLSGTLKGSLPLNIYHGITVCNQEEADRDIPQLLKVSGKRWLSLEPMLGEIDLFKPRAIIPTGDGGAEASVGRIHQVVLGGETGHGARPMHPDHARKVRDDCEAAGVPFYFKGWGEWVPNSHWTHEERKANWKRLQWGTITLDGTFFPQTTPWNGHDDDGEGEAVMWRVGKKIAGRLLDGREHNDLAWPALRRAERE